MITVEIRKQFLRLRTYVGMGLVGLVPIILAAAFKANPPRGFGTLFDLSSSGAMNIAITALSQVSTFLLIVIVSLFAGETVAGEAEWGTLRYLLVRPVTRNRLLAAKLLVSVLLAVIATFLISLVALAVGFVLFGWHSVAVPGFITLSSGQALGRLALATLYVAWSQAAFLSFAFMLSTMTDRALAAVAGGVGLGILSQILNNISALNGTSYVYPTHYLNSWQHLFFGVPQTGNLLRGVLVQVPYVAVFLATAWWWFNRKDVLS
jgi:ABC-2 type transport system permease protein